MKVQESRLYGEGMGGICRQVRVVELGDDETIPDGARIIDPETQVSDWGPELVSTTSVEPVEEPACRRIL